MKVLEVHKNISNSPDGIAVFMINAVENMDRSGMRVDFLSVHSCNNREYISRVEKMGGSLFSLSFSSGVRMFAIFPSMIRFLKENPYDVIHIHTGWIIELTAWAIAAKCTGVRKVIAHSHNNCSKDRLLIHYMKSFFFRPLLRMFVDIECACNYESAEWTFGRGRAKKVHILKNGIPIERFHFNCSQRAEIREKLHIPDTACVIGHVGRVAKDKNQLFLIHVFHALLAKEPNARLLLVGDGPDMKAVRDKVAAMQMEKQVIFQGYCPDVSPFLQAMDVFCFPSVKESFGMASIEAQATGLPVVASTGITTETKLTDHVSFLSLKENADVWADALLKFRSDQRKDQTEKIRQAGYDIQSTAEKMRILYLS